jgi:hypothetical protein
MTLRPHTLVQFGGLIHFGGGGVDEWSCGVRLLTLDGNLPIADPAAYMDSIAAPLLAWFRDSDSDMSSAADISFVKVNNIDAAGHYSDPSGTNEHIYASAQSGSKSNALPFTTSVVYTWESDHSRGPAHRGRIYPPNVPDMTAGLIDTTNRLKHANAGVALIDVLGSGDAGATTAVPSIMSNIDQAFRHIFKVSVDNLPDRQKRRQNAVTPTRVTVDV